MEFASLLDHDFEDSTRNQGLRLSQYMEKGKMIQRFNFIMGNEISDWDISSYIENFSTLLRIQSWDFDSNGWVSWDEWKLIALEKFKDDEGLQKLILKEC